MTVAFIRLGYHSLSGEVCMLGVSPVRLFGTRYSVRDNVYDANYYSHDHQHPSLVMLPMVRLRKGGGASREGSCFTARENRYTY